MSGARDGRSELIFWPEAAVTQPVIDERSGAELDVWDERLRAVRSIRPGQLLATGGLALTSSDGVRLDGATNSVFVLDKGARIVGRLSLARDQHPRERQRIIQRIICIASMNVIHHRCAA